MKNQGRFLITLFLLALSAVEAFAGGWTQKQNSGIVIISASAYRTRSVFDLAGQKNRFSDGGEFRKAEINTYIEYGLTDRAMLIGSIFSTRAGFTNQYSKLSNTGLSDSEFGLRMRLNSLESSTAWSAQGLIKAPTSKNTGQIPIANHQVDVEGGVGVSKNIGHSSSPAFWTVETGYRFRAGAPADEIRIGGTVGVPFGNFLVLGQSFVIKGLRNSASATVDGNPTIRTDFDLYKAQASLVYRLNRSVSLQGGYAANVAGRNTGAGGAANVGVWVSF
jgi:hypothetical protein